jgi:hypothetical protein
MQQALHRSSPVPRGFVVENAYYENYKALLRSGRLKALVCVRRAERFPDASIATIDDACRRCRWSPRGQGFRIAGTELAGQGQIGRSDCGYRVASAFAA